MEYGNEETDMAFSCSTVPDILCSTYETIRDGDEELHTLLFNASFSHESDPDSTLNLIFNIPKAISHTV